jgi:hypothetical protein
MKQKCIFVIRLLIYGLYSLSENIFPGISVKTYIKYVVFIFLVSFFILKNEQVAAQRLPDSIAVFTGEILTADSLKPVVNTHIISKFNHWGTISDEKGLFKMYVNRHDSLLITSVGYRPIILHVNDSMVDREQPYPILMQVDTIQINEVIIRAFWDYETFKLIISKMEPLDFDYDRVNFNENLMLSAPPGGTGLHPIQALYNRFNKDARLERKLIKIREQYNELMIQMGRPEDTIPPMPEYLQESPH